jgi:hypothetical protein
MMRFATCALCIIMLLTRCGTDDNTKRISLIPEMVFNGIATEFPGSLLVDDKYFYIHTPRATDFALRIHDLGSGDEVARIINLGRGPDEFITPSFDDVTGTGLFYKDLNLKKDGILTLSENDPNVYTLNDLPKRDISILTKAAYIDEKTQVYISPSDTQLFKCFLPDREISFGVLFTGRQFENSYTWLQGLIKYHDKKNTLVYSNFRVPYIEMYRYKNESFYLDKIIKDFDHLKFSGDNLDYDPTKKGYSELAISKDYIIGLKRDYEKDLTDERTVGMDFSKLPKTVFVYSFDGKLRYIADLQYPTIRLASTEINNVLYAVIYKDLEFKVVRYILP